MAYILIDGYNLIGTAHDNLEKARNDLIDKLKKYSEIKNHQITLVFDGWKSGQKDQTTIKTRDVTVIYSRLGETADSVIKKMVRSSTINWIVVSSDREVSDYATGKSAAAVTSVEFNDKLREALQAPGSGALPNDTVTGESFIYDIDGLRPDQKGNPRKLSKKDRRKIQALQKL